MICTNCGRPASANAHFCPACGAALGRQTQRATAESLPVSADARGIRAGKGTFLLFLASVLLLLMGAGSMVLSIAGRTTAAQVVGYEQAYVLNSDDSTRDSRRYKLDYAFTAGGERYTGSVTRIFEGGSHMRSSIQVRYLPCWPHINAEDGAAAGLAGPVMLGLGALLLVYGIKKKSCL